jgi:hypothetical protein
MNRSRFRGCAGAGAVNGLRVADLDFGDRGAGFVLAILSALSSSDPHNHPAPGHAERTAR